MTYHFNYLLLKIFLLESLVVIYLMGLPLTRTFFHCSPELIPYFWDP